MSKSKDINDYQRYIEQIRKIGDKIAKDTSSNTALLYFLTFGKLPKSNTDKNPELLKISRVVGERWLKRTKGFYASKENTFYVKMRDVVDILKTSVDEVKKGHAYLFLRENLAELDHDNDHVINMLSEAAQYAVRDIETPNPSMYAAQAYLIELTRQKIHLDEDVQNKVLEIVQALNLGQKEITELKGQTIENVLKSKWLDNTANTKDPAVRAERYTIMKTTLESFLMSGNASKIALDFLNHTITAAQNDEKIDSMELKLAVKDYLIFAQKVKVCILSEDPQKNKRELLKTLDGLEAKSLQNIGEINYLTINALRSLVKDENANDNIKKKAETILNDLTTVRIKELFGNQQESTTVRDCVDSGKVPGNKKKERKTLEK